MVILKTRGTLEEVIKEANLPYDYEQLSGMIEAGAVNSTEVFFHLCDERESGRS